MLEARLYHQKLDAPNALSALDVFERTEDYKTRIDFEVTDPHRGIFVMHLPIEHAKALGRALMREELEALRSSPRAP